MRKLLLFVSILIVCLTGNAQPVKEQSFDDQASIDIQVIRLENSGQKICVVNKVDSITYQCVFYNLDYTEFKTVPIDLSSQFIISDYNSPSLDVRYITENVFDQTNDIDILCQLTYYDGSDGLYAQVLVFHENGSVLFGSDIDNTNAWLLNSSMGNSSISYSLTNTDEGARMILDVYHISDDTYSFDVYSLPGNLPTRMKEQEGSEGVTENYLRAYPVPSNDFVNMEYKLAGDQQSGIIEIIDEQGRTVKKISLDNNRGMIREPVSQYNKGVYIYKLNTRRGIPRTGKVIIVK